MFCIVLLYLEIVYKKQHKLHGFMSGRFCFVLERLFQVCWSSFSFILEGWLYILECGWYWYIKCVARAAVQETLSAFEVKTCHVKHITSKSCADSNLFLLFKSNTMGWQIRGEKNYLPDHIVCHSKILEWLWNSVLYFENLWWEREICSYREKCVENLSVSAYIHTLAGKHLSWL